jgi:ParB-like chromosome segregation protein Spo0J
VKKKPAADKKKKPAPAPEPDSSVAVNCSYTRMVKTDSLKPNPRNPNTHPESQIKLLANIIAKTGWRSPIVVSKRSGFVVKGHGRLMAAQLLGLKSVPVDFQDYPDEETELADLVADNRIAELAEMDNAMLKDILQELDTGNFDMLMTGFDMPSIESLMTEFHVPSENESIDEGAMADTKNECPKCGFKW